MAYQSLRLEYLQIPPVSRAYTTACVLTTAAVVSPCKATFLFSGLKKNSWVLRKLEFGLEQARRGWSPGWVEILQQGSGFSSGLSRCGDP